MGKYVLVMLLCGVMFFCGCSTEQLQITKDTLNAMSASQAQSEGAAAFEILLDETSKPNPDLNILKEQGAIVNKSLNVLGVTDFNLAVDIFLKGKEMYDNKDTVVNNLLDWVANNPGIITIAAGSEGLGLLGMIALAIYNRKKKK